MDVGRLTVNVCSTPKSEHVVVVHVKWACSRACLRAEQALPLCRVKSPKLQEKPGHCGKKSANLNYNSPNTRKMLDPSPTLPLGATASRGPGPQYRGFAIILGNTTLGRTPLDEWLARRRDLYLTTHNTHKTHTYMPAAEFENAIPTSEGPQTHAFDRTTFGIGEYVTTIL